MFFNIKNTAVALAACAVCVFAQSRPFPQAGSNGFVGTVIKPNNRTQDQLDQDVKNAFNTYKNKYYKTSSIGGYILHYSKEYGNRTISEGHGYGMIIFALMGDKDAFDKMNQFRKAKPSNINNKLMSWEIYKLSASGAEEDAATDGDLDNAYALLLAYKQWGDNSYLTDATTLINAIKQSEMHSNRRTKLGDWDNSANASRSSDWMPGHFRAFYEATKDEFWKGAADTVYALLARRYNSTSGLIADFTNGTNADPDATGGGTGE